MRERGPCQCVCVALNTSAAIAEVAQPLPMPEHEPVTRQLDTLGERAAELAHASLAPATRDAYAKDWSTFLHWADQAGHRPLPAEPAIVCDYIADIAALTEAGEPAYSLSTLTRRLAAINAAHASVGLTPPGQHPHVKAVMAGARRTIGRARTVRQAAPLMLNDLRHVLEVMPSTWPAGVTAARDAALLIIGFAGAYRRSELTQLRIRDIFWIPDDGVHLRVRWSKTDQDAQGGIKALPYGTSPATCAPCLLHRWLRVLTATGRPERMHAVLLSADDKHHCRGLAPVAADDLPVFPVMTKHGHPTSTPMSGHAVNQVVKRRLSAAGIDPAQYSGHSLRAGFVTQALRSGATVHEVMNQTLHRNPATVQTYARHHNPLDANAVTKVGL